VIPIGDTPNADRTPWMNWGIIAANVLVYLFVNVPLSRPLTMAELSRPEVQTVVSRLWEQSKESEDPRLPERVAFQVFLGRLQAYDLVVQEFGYKPGASSLVDLFACMFLHAGFLHLAGNMLYLWIFGDNVEARLGPLWYLAAYLFTGVVATFSHAAFAGGSMMPLVGASGAISGMLGFYLVWYPRNRVKILFWIYFFIDIIYLPATLVLLFFLVVQNLFPALLGGPTSTAHGAHLGGFVAGMLLAWLLKDTLPMPVMRPERMRLRTRYRRL